MPEVQAQRQCPAQNLKCGIFLQCYVPGSAGGRHVKHCSIQSPREVLQKVLHLITQIVLLLTDPESVTQKESGVLFFFLKGSQAHQLYFSVLPGLLPPIQILPGEWTVCGWEKFRTMIRHVLASSALHVSYMLNMVPGQEKATQRMYYCSRVGRKEGQSLQLVFYQLHAMQE